VATAGDESKFSIEATVRALTQPFDPADFAGLGGADGGESGELVVEVIEFELGLGELELAIAVALLEVGDLALIFQAVAVLGFGAIGEAEGVLVFLVVAAFLGGAEFAHGELVVAEFGGELLFEVGEFGAFVVED
jgi:hypothetical protein